MDKANFAVSGLAGLGLVGVFILLGLDKEINVVLPIVTLLCGAAVGVNKEAIFSVFKRNK